LFGNKKDIRVALDKSSPSRSAASNIRAHMTTLLAALDEETSCVRVTNDEFNETTSGKYDLMLLLDL
jgi:hypothetical protein